MLKPLNKYLVVDPIEEHITSSGVISSGVIIPDDVKIEDSTYKAVTLLTASVNSKLIRGSKLLVPTHMIEEVAFLGKKYYLVLENCVMGYESE